MRPVRLVVQRFLGLENVVVHFDQGDLFVIVGPNGAGKSSLLEAIFFALYGRGIRVDRGRQELLHRGFPGETLRVELEFLVGEKRFRVIREFSPKRGGAAVFEKDLGNGRWQPVSSGEQAVNREIEKTLGFDAVTFRSSVFLAQGETLRFVEATPAERFGILSNLFGLGILDLMREKVKEDFNRLEGEIKPQEARLQLLEEKRLPEEERRLQEAIHQTAEAVALYRKREEESNKKLKNLERLLTLSRALKDERARQKALLEEQEVARVRAREDQIILEAQRVKMEFWQPWQESLRALQKAEEDIRQKSDRLREVENEEGQTITFLEVLGQRKQAREKELSGAKEKEQAFETARPLLEEIERLKSEESFLQSEVEEAGEKIRRWQEEEKTLQEMAQKLGQEVVALQEALEFLENEVHRLKEGEKAIAPLYEERLNVLREIEFLRREEERILRERERYIKEREELREALQKVTEKFRAVHSESEHFTEEYRQAARTFMVGALRKEWAERGTCPVCGTVVPFRGALEGEMIDFWEWERRYRDLQDATTRLKTQIEHLEERLQDVSRQEEELTRGWKKITEEKQKKEQQKKDVEMALQSILRDLRWKEPNFRPDMLRELIRRKEGELEKLRGQYAQKERECTRVEEQQTGLRKRKEELLARIGEITERHRGVVEVLKKRREEILGFLRRWGEETLLPTAEVSLGKALQTVSTAVRALERELNGIFVEERGSEEKLRHLRKRKEELERELRALQEQRKGHEEAEAQKKKAFQEELERLGWSEEYFQEFAAKKKGNWQERLSAIEGSLRELEERLRNLEKEQDVLADALGMTGRIEHLEEAITEEAGEYNRWRKEASEAENQLGRFHATLEAVRRELAEWQRLTEEVADKKKRQEDLGALLAALEARNFKNYLLGLLFHKLEEEASRVLFTLSGERYMLRMKSDGGKAQMVVVDRRYGQEERFLHECSGGEKTLIALSLALAIPRLWLRERKNQRSLECLFIDEGFSPLDREHLGLVADAILRLGKEGKMVGIVTHDPFFAEYFPLQLEVREGRVSWKRNTETSLIS